MTRLVPRTTAVSNRVSPDRGGSGVSGASAAKSLVKTNVPGQSGLLSPDTLRLPGQREQSGSCWGGCGPVQRNENPGSGSEFRSRCGWFEASNIMANLGWSGACSGLWASRQCSPGAPTVNVRRQSVGGDSNGRIQAFKRFFALPSRPWPPPHGNRLHSHRFFIGVMTGWLRSRMPMNYSR